MPSCWNMSLHLFFSLFYLNTHGVSNSHPIITQLVFCSAACALSPVSKYSWGVAGEEPTVNLWFMWFGERLDGPERGQRHAPSAHCWLTGVESWPGACSLSPYTSLSLSCCLIISPALRASLLLSLSYFFLSFLNPTLSFPSCVITKTAHCTIFHSLIVLPLSFLYKSLFHVSL